MKTGRVRWLVVLAGAVVLPVLATASAGWSRQVDLRLTVKDPNGKSIPHFEAMLHSNQHGYIPWQAGRDGGIHFGSDDIPTLSVNEDPQLQVAIRAPDLAPAILRLEYGMRPIEQTVTLTAGRLIDLFVRTADGRSIPMEVTPLVIYSDFASRVRIHRMPENRRPGLVDDFETSKIVRVADGHYRFHIPVKAEPFLLAIDAPGFMRSVETDYISEKDLADGKIEWVIPAAAKLHLRLNPARAGDFESSWISLAGQIPEEGKYITVWRQQNETSNIEATLADLPPGCYRVLLGLLPPKAQETTRQPYYDDVPFELTAGEEKTLTLTCAPFDPNAWRGTATLEMAIKEYGGKPAAGQAFSLSFVVPHYASVPIQEGVLDDEGRFRLANVRSGPNGPEFFLQVDKEWVRRVRLTEPGNQHFEFTLAPEVGDVVPEITFTDVNDNRSLSLRSLQGHVVYQEFWATWCGPCKIPMVHLNEIMKKRPRYWDGHVAVLAVSIDDTPEIVRHYVLRRGWTSIRHVWTGAKGETGFESPGAKVFGINGVPTALLVAPDGRIVWRGHPKDANPETQIDELLRSTDKESAKVQ